ncbi:MAG: hypothetical protein ACPGYK_07560 [Flavobacteriales bacterium]
MKSLTRWWAVVLTLAVHAAVLFYLAYIPLEGPEETENFVEVIWVENPVGIPEETRTLEEILSERIAERVANLTADQHAEATAEEKSTRIPNEAVAEQVEAELRSFEASEVARLAADAKDFGLADIPEVGTGQVETYEGWNKRYNGEVTVSFDCVGRSAKHLDVPGYRCEEGGVVELEVVVDRDGVVEEVVVFGSADSSCLFDEASKGALRSRFTGDLAAPKRQTCSIRYVFIPQKD